MGNNAVNTDETQEKFCMGSNTVEADETQEKRHVSLLVGVPPIPPGYAEDVQSYSTSPTLTGPEPPPEVSQQLNFINNPNAQIHVGPKTVFQAPKSSTALDDLISMANYYKSLCREKIRDCCVLTTPCVQAMRALQQNKTITLIGGSGEGKSSILHYLASNPMEGFLPVRCTSPNDIAKFIELVKDTPHKLLLVSDNTFGAFYTQTKLVDEWVNRLEYVEMLLGQNEHKLLFATRKLVWADCSVHFRNTELFCNVVEVSSENLTSDDREKMLKQHLGDKGCSLNPDEVESIVGIAKPLAFGQCCRLTRDDIKKHGMSGKRLVEIFKRPFSFIRSQLENMANRNKVEYATLCLVMLCGGKLPCKQLTGTLSDVTPDVKNKIETALDACGCKDQTRGDLLNCANKLTGTFLEIVQEKGAALSVWNTYKFSHDSIHEAVIMEYGLNHLGDCLNFMEPDFLVNIVRPNSYVKVEPEFAIVVPEEYYGEIAKLFTDMVIAGNGNLQEVFRSPFLREELFLSAWCHLLESSADMITRFCQSNSVWNKECLFYYTAESGSERLLRFLMDDQALTCGCPGNHCPLSGAAAGNQTDITSYLLKHHAPSEANVCQALLSVGGVDVLKKLLENLPEFRDDIIVAAMDSACEGNKREVVQYFLDNCCSASKETDCPRRSGLLAASRGGNTGIVHLLLNHSADLDATDKKGFSCLHLAARMGHVDVMMYLISQGGIVNARSKKDITPLHQAVYWFHLKAVSVLLENGAEVNSRDRWGQTPLQVTLRDIFRPLYDKRNTIAAILLQHGAEVGITDKWNRTAVDVAQHEGYQDILNLIAEHGYNNETSPNTRRKQHWPNTRYKMDSKYSC